MSKISVIVPLYNAERFLKTCIDSILNQSFEDFELIIVDDCSTDRSLEIAQQYRDPRIKIFRNVTNLGDAATRNIGLTFSSSKYVYFMDDDDAILANCLEIFYNAIEESNADVVHMNSHYATFDENFSFDGDIDVTKIFDADSTPRIVTSNIVERLQRQRENLSLGIMPWKKIQRRDFLMDNQIYFPLSKCNNDIMQTFAELIFARKILVIDACCYICRVHSASQVHIDPKKNLERAVESIPILIEYLEKIFARSGKIPRDEQIQVELFAAYITFQIFIEKAYKEFSIDEVDELLQHAISKIDPSLIAKMFFHEHHNNL